MYIHTFWKLANVLMHAAFHVALFSYFSRKNFQCSIAV